MLKLSLVLLALLGLLQPLHGEHLGKNKYGVDIFSVDLDLPEEKRFVETSTYFREYVQVVLKQYLDLVPAPLAWLVEKFGGAIGSRHPEYYKELKGMAAAIGVSTNGLLMA